MYEKSWFQDLPLVVLPGLEGNDPTGLNPFQEVLLPHVLSIQIFWWSCFWGILSYLFIWYILIPVWKQNFQKD